MSEPRFEPTTDVEVRITLTFYFTDKLRVKRDGEIYAGAADEARRAMMDHVRFIEKHANSLGLSVEDNDDGVEIEQI